MIDDVVVNLKNSNSARYSNHIDEWHAICKIHQ